MKRKCFFIIYLVFITSVFSQSPKYDLMILTNSKTIKVDTASNKINVSALINYNRFDRVLTSGMQWGIYAIILGATLESLFNQDEYYKYVMTALGGMVASAGGVVYGAFSNIPNGYNVGNNNFGFHVNMGQTMAADSYRFVGNFGVVFRYPNNLFYVPDNYTLYIGEEELTEDFKGNKHSKLNLTKFGTLLIFLISISFFLVF